MSKNIVFFSNVCSVCAKLISELLERDRSVSIFVIVDYECAQNEKHLNDYICEQISIENPNITWINSDLSNADEVNSLRNKFFIDTEFVFSPSFYDFFENELVLEEVFLERLKVAVDFIRLSGGAHLHYISSSIAAGSWFGAFTEYDIQFNDNFNNLIEKYFSLGEQFLQSKFMPLGDAESSYFNHTVYRMPLVLGDSDSGVIFAGDGLYAQILNALPASRSKVYYDKSIGLNCIPVDHAAKVIAANLHQEKKETGFFHLEGKEVCSTHFETLFSEVVAKQNLKAKGRFLYSFAKLTNSVFGNTSIKRHVNDYFYSTIYVDSFRYKKLLAKKSIPEVSFNDIKVSSFYLQNEQHKPLEKQKLASVNRKVYGDFTCANFNNVLIDKINKCYWDNGSGNSVILLSGILGPESFFGLSKILEKKFRVIVTDLIGFGPSSACSEFSISTQIQGGTLKSLLSELEITDKITLVVSDVSAPAAAYFYSRWPKLIKSIIYLNPETSSKNSVLNVNEFSQKEIVEIVSANDNKINFVNSLYFLKNIINKKDRLSYNRLQLLAENICKNERSLKCFLSATTNIYKECESFEYFSSVSSVAWSSNNISMSLTRVVDSLFEVGNSESLKLFPHSSIDFYEESPANIVDYFYFEDCVFDDVFNSSKTKGRVIQDVKNDDLLTEVV